jgi:acyl dehydratase
MTVTDKRRTSKGDKGIVAFKREIRNQHGEAVHSMQASNLYLAREITA